MVLTLHQAVGGTLVLSLRVGLALALVPFPGGRLTPMLVKVGLALVFGVCLYPLMAPQVVEVLGRPPVELAWVLVQEVLVGAVLGFVAALPLWAVRAAGALGDLQVGGPGAGSGAGPLATLYALLAVVLLLLLGGERILLSALVLSYLRLPLGAPFAAGTVSSVATLCIRLSGHLLLVAVGLATPILGALLLADLAAGAINRLLPGMGRLVPWAPLRLVVVVASVLLCVGLLAQTVPSVLSSGLGQIDHAFR